MLSNAFHKMPWQMSGLSALVASGFAVGVLAADYPAKPIRFLVGAAPGGGTDYMRVWLRRS